ncbi:MAG: hypothetical protein Q8Q28_00415 [Pseudomonadota bacterium]|nr:hypothetical protein [Pseudomonadota bacterium]
MTATQEQAALRHAHQLCLGHREALQDALADLGQRGLAGEDLDRLNTQDRRLLDQFAYRYTRLQDDMGNRLFPAVLRALGEEIAAMPVLDRLNRLEQLGWLPSADAWADLRRIRNEFTHDYPESAGDRLSRLQLAIQAASRLLEVLAGIDRNIAQRFPEMAA